MNETPPNSQDIVPADETTGTKPPVSRRGFLRGLGGGLASAAITGGLLTAQPDEADAKAAAPKDLEILAGRVPVSVTVNGQKRTATVDTRRTLLQMLRSDFDLTGTKLVCDHGACGACTVLMDGKPVYSCLTLALDADGHKIETVEGLAKGEKFHPLQTAFVEQDALMCGFCTPGFLMSSKALLDQNPRPTLDDVKTACSGNLCRCGTYPRIFEAVLDASKKV